jgi:RND family efflux transporter MFP subunit
MKPILMDTAFANDYVADIHSIQHVEIRARVKGYIEKINVDEGKSVKAGQIIFSLSNKEHKEALTKARAYLTSAVAESKSAEVELQSVKSLVEKNVISKTELQLAEAKLQVAQAKIEEARSEEANAILNLSFTEIKAPFDGIINRIPKKTGSLVDEGDLLTTLSDNRDVYAYFRVSEKEYLGYISKQEQGQKKEVELILADGTSHGHVGVIETVEGEFDRSTGNIGFRAKFPNPKQVLKHGSSGKVRLKTDLKNALLVWQKSTFEIQEKVFVFVVDKNNIVQMRNIVTRLQLPTLYVVASGLSSTDVIIYEGVQRVKEGDKIIPQVISEDSMLAHSTNNNR